MLFSGRMGELKEHTLRMSTLMSLCDSYSSWIMVSSWLLPITKDVTLSRCLSSHAGYFHFKRDTSVTLCWSLWWAETWKSDFSGFVPGIVSDFLFKNQFGPSFHLLTWRTHDTFAFCKNTAVFLHSCSGLQSSLLIRAYWLGILHGLLPVLEPSRLI